MNEQNHVPTILAVSCQKGGEGKTTAAWHIGAALTQRGYKVCLIDCDPDHHLSFALGWQDDERATLTNLVLMAIVMGQFPDADAISATIRRHDEGYDYIPCTKKLADANLFLASMPNNETYLRHILRDTTAFADYHYVILDGLPGDNLLQKNVLAAADDLIIPIQPKIMDFSSGTEMMPIVRAVQERSNPNLRIVGSVLTMFDNTTTARDIHTLLKESEDFAALHPFDASISRLKEAGEAPGLHVSCVSREKSKIGQQYQAIADEYLARKEP